MLEIYCFVSCNCLFLSILPDSEHTVHSLVDTFLTHTFDLKEWFFKNDCSLEFLWTFRTGGRIWDDNGEVSPSTQLPWALSTWGDPSEVSKSCQCCYWLMLCKTLIKYDSDIVVYIFYFLQRSYVKYKRKNLNKGPRHPA